MRKRRAHRHRARKKNHAAKSPRLSPMNEALEYGHFSRSYAYVLLSRKKIEARKMGRRTLIDLNSVDRYLQTLPQRNR